MKMDSKDDSEQTEQLVKYTIHSGAAFFYIVASCFYFLAQKESLVAFVVIHFLLFIGAIRSSILSIKVDEIAEISQYFIVSALAIFIISLFNKLVFPLAKDETIYMLVFLFVLFELPITILAFSICYLRKKKVKWISKKDSIAIFLTRFCGWLVGYILWLILF